MASNPPKPGPYVLGMHERLRTHKQTMHYLPGTVELLYRITDEDIARQLLVLDDEYQVLHPNSPAIVVVSLIARQFAINDLQLLQTLAAIRKWHQ